MKRRAAKRQQVEMLLQAQDWAAITAMAAEDGSLLTLLLQYTFAPDSLLCWRATEAIGEVAVQQPKQVALLIPRLLWSLNEDSGSFGWGAAAVLGEIGRRNYGLVADIIELLRHLVTDIFAREGMLWGLGRLAQSHPEAVLPAAPQIQAYLQDAQPQCRAYAAWCLGQLGYREAAPALRELLADQEPVRLYDNGVLQHFTVGQVAAQALKRLETAALGEAGPRGGS